MRIPDVPVSLQPPLAGQAGDCGGSQNDAKGLLGPAHPGDTRSRREGEGRGRGHGGQARGGQDTHRQQQPEAGSTVLPVFYAESDSNLNSDRRADSPAAAAGWPGWQPLLPRGMGLLARCCAPRRGKCQPGPWAGRTRKPDSCGPGPFPRGEATRHRCQAPSTHTSLGLQVHISTPPHASPHIPPRKPAKARPHAAAHAHARQHLPCVPPKQILALFQTANGR